MKDEFTHEIDFIFKNNADKDDSRKDKDDIIIGIFLMLNLLSPGLS